MTSSRMLSWQDKHAHVLAYLAVGYGHKTGYLREHGVTPWQIRVWCSQVYAGSLEQGLIPRGGGLNSVDENREISRLVRVNRELEARLADQERRHQEALAAKDGDLNHQKLAVAALGKAIALLHPDDESAADTTGQ